MASQIFGPRRSQRHKRRPRSSKGREENASERRGDGPGIAEVPEDSGTRCRATKEPKLTLHCAEAGGGRQGQTSASTEHAGTRHPQDAEVLARTRRGAEVCTSEPRALSSWGQHQAWGKAGKGGRVPTGSFSPQQTMVLPLSLCTGCSSFLAHCSLLPAPTPLKFQDAVQKSPPLKSLHLGWVLLRDP